MGVTEKEDLLNIVPLQVEQRRQMSKTMTDEIEMHLEKGPRIDTYTVKQVRKAKSQK
jgi:hypothetical protein